MAAARKLVATDGADVPLTAIADEAGVGIATLYRNFPTREELFVAVVLDGRDRVHALVDEHRPRVVADPVAGWSPFVRALAELRLGALLPELAGFLRTAPRSSELVQMREEALSGVESVLDVVRRAGVVSEDVTAVRFVVGLGMVTRALPAGAPFDVAGQHEWMIEIYLRGLQPRATPGA
ncbi:TetR/AcrR family transcriptional regulator [Luteimicrobium sp. NPDC057192]|uniref:TetR/AcrR family transcriptional regulator n=1 Tax=Luteimicrobium sp. NPDC057192 TaxID=3346042 RepID=UPI0036299C88